jgi:hypothetical protein
MMLFADIAMAPVTQIDRNIFALASSTAYKRKGVKLPKTAILIMSDREKLEQFEQDVMIYGTESDKRIMAKESVGDFLSDAIRFSKSKKTRLTEIHDEIALLGKTLIADEEAHDIAAVVMSVNKARRAANSKQKEEDKMEIMSRMLKMFDGDEAKLDEFRIIMNDIELMLKPAYAPPEE